ncbi:MAG: GtrA family protein [Candidatus Omnitrophica bacterium]|nr:GtrA family protein [Candidatus Omnitrophota bacterium]
MDARGKKIIRFLISGTLVTATDFSLYYILSPGMPFSVAKGISFSSAGMAGYWLNKYWTFKNNQSAGAQLGRYAFINILALAINVFINQQILRARPGEVFGAFVTATALTSLFVFAGFKWWVFGSVLKERIMSVWWKWFPWRFLVRDAARRRGFLDPIKILAQLQNFSQPAEVTAPTELLRSGVVLHARGLINSLAIQHNLDWIWPYWVECQYNPRDAAFIPRAFSLTQINLTHRNWTALGIPDSSEFSIVDPRGLVTPLYDGWSLDSWIIPKAGAPLIPCRLKTANQKLDMKNGLTVRTEVHFKHLKLQTNVQVIGSAAAPICQLRVKGLAAESAWLVISLRPYNPEGVSFIQDIAYLSDRRGWRVNKNDQVYFDTSPERGVFSYYQRGDVYSSLLATEREKEIFCKVGMASAAVLYALEARKEREITVSIPLGKNMSENDLSAANQNTTDNAWRNSLQGACGLQIPDTHFQFLYDAAIRTMVLHCPKEVYPGPFIYRRFWFRDAAFILSALLATGFKERVRRALDCFRARQTPLGYFLSQEGEWDSNGEALWIMRQYCEMTGESPPPEWKESIRKAGQWISKKRLPADIKFAHAGLLPAGFSAEHLGPNDYYYWDDFWAVAGLNAAAFFGRAYRETASAAAFEKDSRDLTACINRSLQNSAGRLHRPAIPASPYRRLDTGAIGSLAASYPLRLFEPADQRIIDTANFLMEKCLVQGGFFHDMTHSGINPYLTLHLAQALLRAGDPRYFDLLTAVAKLASSTGQWPEAVHPFTGGGCMGDGQHVWAAAEWVLMIRNCFVREEAESLILCSGIPRVWIEQNQSLAFGPAPTSFGDIQIVLKPLGEMLRIEWKGQWFREEPRIEIRLPGFLKVAISPGTDHLELPRGVNLC